MSAIVSSHERAILSGTVLPSMTFTEKAWALTTRIPPGSVATYGEIARVLGSGACRAVGYAMSRNPYAPRVPCHRVVGSDGRLTGYAGGLPEKRRMLEAEGVTIRGNRVDLARHGFRLEEVKKGG